MKKPSILRTPFSIFHVGRCIGQGGNGYVYEIEEDGSKAAAKLLDQDRVTKEKLKRFENEYRFCSIERHPNIIQVSDYGISEDGVPFFTMPLYNSSLRSVIGKLEEDKVYEIILKVLNGVEAAHRFGVKHRDLKPENILVSKDLNEVVLTDFGISEFAEEELFTAVETDDGTRLANFQYAAPEQRIRKGTIDYTTDIYSLGLILNELFTGELALGKNHQPIGEVSEKYSYLDSIVEKMLQQSKGNRYQSIEELKVDLSARSKEYISSLKISELKKTAIPSDEVDDPIISDPMRIVDVQWENGILYIDLNHQPSENWKSAFLNMGSHTSVLGKGPEYFQFKRNTAHISVDKGNDAQRIIDHFKDWLPRVAEVYERKLQQDAEKEKQRKIRQRELEIERAEKTKTINQQLKF